MGVKFIRPCFFGRKGCPTLDCPCEMGVDLVFVVGRQNLPLESKCVVECGEHGVGKCHSSFNATQIVAPIVDRPMHGEKSAGPVAEG